MALQMALQVLSGGPWRRRYGDGTLRLTVEENVLFPNVANDVVPAMLADPIFQKFQVEAGPLMRGLVSCTGLQHLCLLLRCHLVLRTKHANLVDEAALKLAH